MPKTEEELKETLQKIRKDRLAAQGRAKLIKDIIEERALLNEAEPPEPTFLQKVKREAARFGRGAKKFGSGFGKFQKGIQKFQSEVRDSPLANVGFSDEPREKKRRKK